MTPRLTTEYAQNCCNLTPVVQVIVETVVTWFFETQYRMNRWSFWFWPDLSWTKIHRVRKKRPPKHVQITLWIENDSHYFSLYHDKPSICNVCVKFHDNQSVRCGDIAFYKKMVENCRRQHCQLTRARNAYLRPSILTPAHCASAFT